MAKRGESSTSRAVWPPRSSGRAAGQTPAVIDAFRSRHEVPETSCPSDTEVVP